MRTEIDMDEFEEKLMRAILEVYGYDRINGDTPMHEVRALAEQAGSMYGRVFAAALHEGPVTSDIASAIQEGEREGREKFLRSAHRLLKPGGKLRAYFNDRENGPS